MKYRNKKLTESAKHERCVSCGAMDGTVVWAHSNQNLHGKGMGTKAHDLFGFYGCSKCHDWYDGRSKDEQNSMMHHANKFDWFAEMWERSMIIACEKGYL